MNKEEKEAIERLLKKRDLSMIRNDTHNLLNLIQKHEKIIDKMAEELYFDCWERVCQECCKECERDKDTQINCIIEYFKKEVEHNG